MKNSQPSFRRLPSRGIQMLGLLISIAITFAAAGLAGVASASAGSFYAELNRPTWAPPAWLFGPVWMILYALIAIAAWLVWRQCGWWAARYALLLYAIQLAANALWSWLFFAWREGAWAFVDIVLLWILIFATLVVFARYSRWATALLLPYLAWVSFAAILCFAIWRMNPELL